MDEPTANGAVARDDGSVEMFPAGIFNEVTESALESEAAVSGESAAAEQGQAAMIIEEIAMLTEEPQIVAAEVAAAVMQGEEKMIIEEVGAVEEGQEMMTTEEGAVADGREDMIIDKVVAAEEEEEKMADDEPENPHGISTELDLTEQVKDAVRRMMKEGTVSQAETPKDVRLKAAAALGVKQDDLLPYKQVIKTELTNWTWLVSEHDTDDHVADESIEQAENESDDEDDDGQGGSDTDSEDDLLRSVVWCQTNSKWPWWPSYVFPPLETSGRIRKLADKHRGSKYLVYFYGDGNFDVAKPAQIKPFEAHREAMAAQSMSKRYRESFQKGLKLAQEDNERDIGHRVAWLHKTKRHKKSKSSDSKKDARESVSSAVNSKNNVSQELSKDNELDDIFDKEEDDNETFNDDEDDGMDSAASDEDYEEKNDEPPSAKRHRTPRNSGASEASSSGKRKKSHDELASSRRKSSVDTQESDVRVKVPHKNEVSKKARARSAAQYLISLVPETKAMLPSAKHEPSGASAKKRPRSERPSDQAKKRPKKDQKVAVNKPVKLPVEETREQRLKRYMSLLTEYADKSALPEKAVRTLNKIKEMNVSIEEMKIDGLSKQVKKLTKHPNSALAECAKIVTAEWMERVTKLHQLATTSVTASVAQAGAPAETVDPAAEVTTHLDTHHAQSALLSMPAEKPTGASHSKGEGPVFMANADHSIEKEGENGPLHVEHNEAAVTSVQTPEITEMKPEFAVDNSAEEAETILLDKECEESSASSILPSLPAETTVANSQVCVEVTCGEKQVAENLQLHHYHEEVPERPEENNEKSHAGTNGHLSSHVDDEKEPAHPSHDGADGIHLAT